jgi:hypothetical protein
MKRPRASRASSLAAAPRREFLARAFNGFGALALAKLLAQDSALAKEISPLAERAPHRPRKAKRCIFLFMAGGVSQVDSFEHKPVLNRLHGQPLPRIPSLETGELEGRLGFPHAIVGSPFRFERHGASGRSISELFPCLSRHADDLAFIHGVKTENQNHGPSTLHVTTGSPLPGSPSVGAWIQYGLGSPNQDLPGYVVIQDPRGAPTNGAAVWSNGYLPAAYQGTLLRPSGAPILDLDRPPGVSAEAQRRDFDLLAWLNRRHLAERSGASDLEARIDAYELAFRMQTAAPELVDLSSEPEEVKALYGLDQPRTAGFGRQCLLARRLVERGVRFTLLVHGVQIGRESWDDHGDVRGGMIRHAGEVDLPIAGLLGDLKRRGLLEETLVVWSSEMGRTPFVNGALGAKPGRDHNGHALCMWVAGGDIRGGATAGETDEFSLRSTGEPIPIRDVHATILHLLGLDDVQLTYHHAGRLRKLTDTGGKVLREIVA